LKELKEFESSLTNVSKEETIRKVFANALDKGIAIAAYSLPDSKKVTIIAGKITEKPPLLEAAEPGFILSPFFNEQSPVSFIAADVEITLSENNIESKGKATLKALLLKDTPLVLPEIPEVDYSKPGNYQEIVLKAVEEIRKGVLKKVVVARKKRAAATKPIEVIFLSLVNAYPSAFTALIFHPNFGIWIGASPELLIHLNKEKIFKTIALAGTIKAPATGNVNNTSWSQKEIEEQALVSKYIVNCFKKLRLREYEEEGPKSILSGNLIHLKTTYNINTQASNFPFLASQMLQLIHPTSAVGGMPREEALRFITENEHLERVLFAGFWGPVNINQEINLYVNIRCARLFNNFALLFAGAGITEASDPEKEFFETEIKMEAIASKL